MYLRTIFGSLLAMSLLFFSGLSNASNQHNPDDVYSKVDYAFRLTQKLLENKSINDLSYPVSHEKTVKPMHVYELHVSVITELYRYSLKNDLTPPPLTFSSPIVYTPIDVYKLSKIIVDSVESIYKKDIGFIAMFNAKFKGKTPKDVYGKLYELYYGLVRLNDAKKVSPNNVYAQAKRAKEDLQIMLLTLSKRLNNKEIDKKRLLVTATYGMHPDGSTMSAFEKGKKPKDVIQSAFGIRKKLNTLRKTYKMKEVAIPNLSDYATVAPVDAFLQTQFIIAEINLLKSPFKINHSTNVAIDTDKKTPSDVYQEMKHISYLLDRLISL